VWWKRKIQIIKLPNSATINVNTDFDRPEEAINVGIEKGNRQGSTESLNYEYNS